MNQTVFRERACASWFTRLPGSGDFRQARLACNQLRGNLKFCIGLLVIRMGLLNRAVSFVSCSVPVCCEPVVGKTEGHAKTNQYRKKVVVLFVLMRAQWPLGL